MGDRKAVGSMKYQPIRKQKKGFFFLFGSEVTKEMNHSRDERADTGFNRWNIVGMNESTLCVCVCLYLCVRRLEGGNGIRGNTFGRAGRAT